MISRGWRQRGEGLGSEGGLDTDKWSGRARQEGRWNWYLEQETWLKYDLSCASSFYLPVVLFTEFSFCPLLVPMCLFQHFEFVCVGKEVFRVAISYWSWTEF